MATPIFDEISVQFSRAIGDPVADAANDGSVLTADERSSYVNRAANLYFRQEWDKAQGNAAIFLANHPEVFKSSDEWTISSGKVTYNASSAKGFDVFFIVDGYIATDPKTYAPAYRGNQLTLFKTEYNDAFKATSSRPAIVQVSDGFYVFPSSITENVSINYIPYPVNPENGSALTQGGTYDIPFGYTDVMPIVDIAVQLFKRDVQE